MAAKRIRWDCPTGEHPGVLGSTRPPIDSIVRYCWPCSEESGRLVKRVAPALERKRAAKSASAAERRQVKAERSRAAARRKRVLEVREADGSRGEVDIPKTLERMIRLPVLRDHAERACPYYKLQAPEVTLRRSRSKYHTSGHVWNYSWEFVVTASADSNRQEFEETLLHELVHLLLPRANHSMRYRSLLCQAAREWWPGITVRPEDEAEVYALDSLIVKQARKLEED